MLLVVLLVYGVTANTEPTTTRTYEIEVPGSDPIRIVEGESIWGTTSKPSQQRAFSGSTNDPLHQFLNSYAETVRRNKYSNKNDKEEHRQELESVELITPDYSTERGKSWDMLQYQTHHHPFDDAKGWISMEPVPWSVSKISKWQSKYKPPQSNEKWDQYDSDETVRPWNRPSFNYDAYIPDKKPETKPYPSKPYAVYNQKVHVNYGNKYKHDENCDKHKHDHQPVKPFYNDDKHKHDHQPAKPFYNDGDIITDGLPANFPQPYDTNRRHGTDLHPDTHPFSGEGEWVLLSTTKGYKYPRERKRSMQINPESIGAHRGVHLTVLPPLKNSKVNMTTSHGGLLQVESTFQTVEESHKQYKKKQQKIKKKKLNLTKRPKPVRQVVAPSVATTQRSNSPDSSAIMAAVGAGMIPATMAMLVPMALGGRRKRDVSATQFQVTLPRNL